MNAQEFEYLAIYFCFALLKSRSGKRICIGVYNGGGRAETVMYFNAVRGAFLEEDYEVRIVDYGDLFQRERGTVDICVSTCSLEEPSGAEVVMIGPISRRSAGPFTGTRPAVWIGGHTFRRAASRPA